MFPPSKNLCIRIGLALTLGLTLVSCTRDRTAGDDDLISLDPESAEVIAERMAEAAAAAVPADTPVPPITYVVKENDTLAGIAQNHHVTVAVIRELNPQLQSDRLQPGDELLIPVATASPPTPEPEEVEDGLFYYVVQDGDTISGIAAKFGVTMKEIEEVNPALFVDQIAVGQRLAVPQVEREPAPAVEEEDPNALFHVVRQGDTLASIAAFYQVDALEIARINQLHSPDKLAIDQRLRLPDDATFLPPPEEEAPPGEGLIHIVRKGDTLSGIALKYQVKVSDLVAANNLRNVDQLALGQELFVPGVTAEEQSTIPAGSVHVVQPGDTLTSIAASYGVTIEQLMVINSLEDGDILAVGQELTVPETSPADEAAE